MTKVAIFTEGQTEQIFVRELLLRVYEYSNIEINCFKLFSENNLNPAEYNYAVDNANKFFQIIDVGNDERVMSVMLRRRESLLSAGFTKIIGLRDMYSAEYKKNVSEAKIDLDIIEKFKNGHNSQLQDGMYLFFAIMEIESWFLGMNSIFDESKIGLSLEEVNDIIGCNLNEIDPETTFYHPAFVLGNILDKANMKNIKSRSNVNSIVSNFQKDDYISLSTNSKCQSFSDFFNCIII